MMSSIRLPTHMEAIMPQNRVGFLVITCGPGMMPWMVMAPTMRAITALGGMPRVSSGMNEVCAPALLALSVPALRVVEVAHDLGDAEDAHGQHGEVNAVGQERQPEGHALLAGFQVGADRREQD